MSTPVLDKFSKLWISLFAHSPRAKIALQTHTGKRPKTYSATSWWSKFEVIKQVHALFRQLPTFLNQDDLPEKTKKKLRDIVFDQQQFSHLKVELAATVDAMEPFVKVTYNLEGNGAVALQTCQELRFLDNFI